MKMTTTDAYTNQALVRAQELLWGGSETENIEAHNIIAKLIKDRLGEAQGQVSYITHDLKKRLKGIDQIGNILYN